MDERILKWLYDINFALIEIESYFEGKEKTFLNTKKILCSKEQLKETWRL